MIGLLVVSIRVFSWREGGGLGVCESDGLPDYELRLMNGVCVCVYIQSSISLAFFYVILLLLAIAENV